MYLLITKHILFIPLCWTLNVHVEMLQYMKDPFYLNGSAGRVGIGGVTGLAGALGVGAPQHFSSGLEHLATKLTLMLTLPLVL